jgi:hypothetical protein
MMDERNNEDQQLGLWIREAGNPAVEPDAVSRTGFTPTTIASGVSGRSAQRP